jgi:hypothetical protein
LVPRSYLHLVENHKLQKLSIKIVPKPCCNLFQIPFQSFCNILIHLVCSSVSLGHGRELGMDWARTRHGHGRNLAQTGHGHGRAGPGRGARHGHTGHGHGRTEHGLGTGGLGTVGLCPNVTGTQ